MSIEKLKKPNQTIVITNREITATQRKAYNIILHKAQKELREDNSKTTFLFSISELKKKAGIKATNNIELKESIFLLMGIVVETIKENKNNWRGFTLISYVNKEGDLLEIELSKTIREALIKNDYYTTLDLLIIKSLTGIYAIILYELAIRYEKVKIPKMTVKEFKAITGTEEIKSYNNFNLLKVKVIEPAIREINEKTDILLEYEAEKIGKSYVSIEFKVTRKIENIKMEESKSEKIYIEEVKQLFSLLPLSEQLESRKAELEKLLKNHSFEYLKADIMYMSKKNPNDFWAYFIKSTQEGHFSKADIEKEKKKEEIKKASQEKEAREKEEALQQKIELEKESEELAKYITEEEKKNIEKIYDRIEKILKSDMIPFDKFVIQDIKTNPKLLEKLRERKEEAADDESRSN